MNIELFFWNPQYYHLLLIPFVEGDCFLAHKKLQSTIFTVHGERFFFFPLGVTVVLQLFFFFHLASLLGGKKHSVMVIIFSKVKRNVKMIASFFKYKEIFSRAIVLLFQILHSRPQLSETFLFYIGDPNLIYQCETLPLYHLFCY